MRKAKHFGFLLGVWSVVLSWISVASLAQAPLHLTIQTYPTNIKANIDLVRQNDANFAWQSEAHRYVFINSFLEASTSMGDKQSSRALQALLAKHSSAFPDAKDKYYSQASNVLAESYNLTEFGNSPDVFKTTLPFFREALTPFWFQSDTVRIGHYTRLIDVFIRANDFQTAEVVLYGTYGEAVEMRYLLPKDAFKIHVRAFEVMAELRKYTELKKIFEEILALDSKGLNYQEPDVFLLASRLAYSLVGVAEFERAKLMLLLFEKNRDIQAEKLPKPAFMNFTLADSLTKVFTGLNFERKAFDWIQPDDEVLAIINLLEFFSPRKQPSNLNDANELEAEIHLLKKIKNLNFDRKVQKFALAALLERHALMGNKAAFITILRELSDIFLADFRFNSPLDFDKKHNSLDKKLLESVARSTSTLFPQQIPQELVDLILPLMVEHNTEVDANAAVNNLRVKAHFDTSKQMQSLYKLSREFAANLSFIASKITQNSLKNLGSKHQQVIKEKSTNIGYAFRNELFKHIKRYYFTVNEITKDSSLTDNPFPNVEALQARLADDEALYIASLTWGYLFICDLSKEAANCFIKQTSSSLIDKINRFRKQIAESNKTQPFDTGLSDELYKIFFSATNIKEKKKIFVHVGANLIFVPFNALTLDKGELKTFLGHQVSISLVPSLIGKSSHKSDTRVASSYVGVGNPQYAPSTQLASASNIFTVRSAMMAKDLAQLPPLPETEIEIRNAAKQFKDAEVFLGSDASELNFRLSKFYKADVIHIATHGLISGEIDASRLSSPSLALTFNSAPDNELEDGLLTSLEVAELDIQAQSVILSACRTMSDRGEPNAGFSGLTAAFLSAGAKSVLATQWPVETNSAEKFISIFTRKLASSSEGPSKALKYSYKNFASDPNLSPHPFFWAPFVNVEFLPAPTEKQSIKNLNITFSERKAGGNSEYLTSWTSGGQRYFIGYETVFSKETSRSFVAWLENSKERRVYFDGGNVTMVSSSGDDAIFATSPQIGKDFSGLQFEIFNAKTKQLSKPKVIKTVSNFVTVVSQFLKYEGGYYALGANFGTREKVKADYFILKFSKLLEFEYSIPLENSVSPKFSIHDESLHIADYWKMSKTVAGKWEFLLGLSVNNVTPIFGLRKFDESRKTISDWLELPGVLLSLISKIDERVSIVSYDPASFDVLKFDHNKQRMVPLFKWPEQVLGLQNIQIGGKKYWLVNSMERISLANRFGLVDEALDARNKSLVNGGFLEGKIIASDHENTQTIFSFEHKAGPIYRKTSRLTGFINVFDANGERILISGVNNRDELYVAEITPPSNGYW